MFYIRQFLKFLNFFTSFVLQDQCPDVLIAYVEKDIIFFTIDGQETKNVYL